MALTGEFAPFCLVCASAPGFFPLRGELACAKKESGQGILYLSVILDHRSILGLENISRFARFYAW